MRVHPTGANISGWHKTGASKIVNKTDGTSKYMTRAAPRAGRVWLKQGVSIFSGLTDVL